MSGPEPLPPELEARIAAIESGAESGDDFDAASLGWLVLLGVLLPLGLLWFGWRA